MDTCTARTAITIELSALFRQIAQPTQAFLDEPPPMSRPFILIAAAVAAIVAGIAAWYAWHQTTPEAPPPIAAPEPLPPVAAVPVAPPIQHPVEEAPLAAEPMTAEPIALDHSDVAMREAAAGVFPEHALPQFLRVDRIIRNIVATIDALPRGSVSPTVMPVNPAAGRMTTADDAGTMTIASDNSLRYAPYVDVLRRVDARTAAATYLRHYALFQQAYRELGYPHGYFNDRLVQVIDLLLATPDVHEPIKIEQPKVLFVYADPALEALPAGQKIMLRIGHDNALIVKAKLREIRNYIARNAPPK